MKKISVLFFVLIFMTGCGQKESEKVILCGTSVISSMVRDITGDNNVKTLVPHLVCPGSYDLKPDDAKKIINSKILIIHPFQKYLLDKIIQINKNIRVIYVDLSDLNSPGGYINGLDEVEKFLMEIFPEKKQQYAMNKENTVSKIKQRITDDAMLVKTISNKNIKVIASSRQQGFCNYLGLKVVSVFSGPDSLKPKDLADIIKLAKK